MKPTIKLIAMTEETNFAPLGVLGYCLTRSNFLDPLFCKLNLQVKIVKHKPSEKLLDIIVSILAGCRAISQVNTRIRPDLALARAWKRPQFAEQATLARTLNAFTTKEVAELREGSQMLFRRESRTLRHNFEQDWLYLDIDLTPLPISKQAEGSTKGKIGKKNQYGRQLARVMAPQYKETLFSRLYPGKQHSSPTYIPLFEALASFLSFDEAQKQKSILRSDAGFGSDANINYALKNKWQVLTKGSGGLRPKTLAKKIQEDDWLLMGDKRWVAKAIDPPTYLNPTLYWVLRWETPKGKIKYGTLVCSILDWPIKQTLSVYDDRASCEIEIRQDKQALKLVKRRKKSLAAQEALILLTDVAHNILAWASHWMFPTEPLASFGTTRMIEDIFTIPGRLIFREQQLVEVQLNELHPYAQPVMDGLTNLLRHF